MSEITRDEYTALTHEKDRMKDVIKNSSNKLHVNMALNRHKEIVNKLHLAHKSRYERTGK